MTDAVKRAAVIGSPIDHSRSPLIYRSWLRELGIAGDYTRIRVEPPDIAGFMRDFVDGANTNDLVGFNVTLPHKVDVLRLTPEPDDRARAIGAANLVWRDGRSIRCTNTDGDGFMAHLDQASPQWRTLSGRSHVLLLGAGGAARALLYGFLTAGVDEITIVNRTAADADRLVAAMTEIARGRRVTVRSQPWSEMDDAVTTASVIVNTTSLGMNGIGTIDLDLARAPADATVADIVYVPLETAFLTAARWHGLRTVDGLGMLLHQAVPAFECYWGVRPEVTAGLRAALEADIEGR